MHYQKRKVQWDWVLVLPQDHNTPTHTTHTTHKTYTLKKEIKNKMMT